MEKKSIISAQTFDENKFTKTNVFKNETSTLFVLNFLPKQQLPAHYHPGHELYLHVLQGNGTFTIDEIAVEVTKDDVIHVTGDENLAFTNTGENNVSIYVTMSKLPK
ncbi:cupin domain-containing protein [Virgibacillus sp. C22-A2]|uniref:Cupin domain-containing protein n=1 Tax=Virgibacillus tibetensis TaxID=3042313 RepID=A0ABU6KCW8_9BACI|nr:cupin domain-containing protein [Virgibacillus sp. C22-A2]